MSPPTQLVLLYKHCMYKYLCSLQLLWVCLCSVWHVWNQLQVAVCSNYICTIVSIIPCVYVRMYVCMWVDACVDISLRMCMWCVGISMHVHMRMYVVHVYMCFMCICVCVCVCVCALTRACACVCVCLCVCVQPVIKLVSALECDFLCMYRYLPSKRPWTLEIHGRKNGDGRLHGEAICTYNPYTHRP